MTDAEDRALLAAHVAGDAEAFGVLFSRHSDRLWSIALRTMRHHQEAEEALQEAMISAFRRASTFRGGSAVLTWLHRIVVNACYDRLRRIKARPVASSNEDAALNLPSLAAGPEEVALRSNLTEDIEAALATLSVDQRTALLLVDVHGYSIAEAAEILGCAPGTVKSRCSRARTALAPRLRAVVEA